MDSMIFKALFDHSSIGIIISNSEGEIEKCNPFAAKIFGYSEKELVGQLIEVLVPEKHRVRHVEFRNMYNRNPINRAMGGTLSVTGLKKDNSIIPVEISLTHFEEEDELHIVSYINDITERKKAESVLETMAQNLEDKVKERTTELSDALIELNHSHSIIAKEIERRKKVEENILETLERERDLNQLKSQFVSMASHEFRTPLGGILSSASLLVHYNKPGMEVKHDKHVKTIKKSVTHLTTILNEFLSLDKLDQGSVKSHPSEFLIYDLISEVIEGLKSSNEKEHNFKVEINDKGIKLKQDKDILRNVLINLLSNAIKYSPVKSTVTVICNVQGAELVLSVIDQGIGIPVEEQKHLFERFFRAKNVNTIQGTGLGLNIVKSYLKLLSGTIDFVSKENEGTTFNVRIPLEFVE